MESQRPPVLFILYLSLYLADPTQSWYQEQKLVHNLCWMLYDVQEHFLGYPYQRRPQQLQAEGSDLPIAK